MRVPSMKDDHADVGSSAMEDSANRPAPSTLSIANIDTPSGTTPTPARAPSESPQPNTPRPAESLEKRNLQASQPMTATSSSSSIPPDQQINNADDSTGPSPYGTRSRNRTGIARPNYAEDRESEMDFEWASAKKRSRGVSGSGVPGSSQSAEAERSSGSNTRRSSNAAGTSTMMNGKSTPLDAPRDHIPGMSSFSVITEPIPIVPAPAPSRKRKAPGTGPANSHTPPNTTQAGVIHSQRRQGAAGAFNSNTIRTTNLMTFEGCQGYLKKGRLEADDGNVLSVNDQIYLICEPPGEPYYLARIMEFLHVDNDQSRPVDSLRVNWYFRPRDIQRKTTDTRVVFASMQSDTSPITSVRGKCRVLHKNDIPDMDEYRKTKDSFWYEKMFDRYIHRYYEVIPTSHVINVPAKVKNVLDERWKYVVVEIGRGKELTSAIKSCKRCRGYCASNDSVDCAVCKNTYHMNCVQPPLLKKPARGFGWSCGPCSRKQERRLEARITASVGDKNVEGEDEEFVEEEEDEHPGISEVAKGDYLNDPDSQISGPRPPTAEQIAQARLWPYRYLGIHCRVEDALDYDDRIYPRASSRLGPKHQAVVQAWHGRPVRFVKLPDTKRKYLKGGGYKKDTKPNKDTSSVLETERTSKETRPKWVMDEPFGYIARGDDFPNSDLRNTAQLTFRMPQVGEQSSRDENAVTQGLDSVDHERLVDEYMNEAKKFSFEAFGLHPFSTNFLDKALEVLVANNYQKEQSIRQLKKMKRRTDFKEPEMGPADQKRFEDGVSKFGSELRNVSRHFGKSKSHGEIVRYYYMWKKSPAGQQIWGNFEGRKGKKQAKQNYSKLVDDVADDEDDSAFDNGKAIVRKRGFECKFCQCRKSPQWRRAPGTAPGTTVPADASTKPNKEKGVQLLVALCQRCAGLWRKYGIPWENIDEVAKKVTQAGGRAWKRKMDGEMLSELASANEASSIGVSSTVAAAAASVGIELSAASQLQAGQDGLKKKQKGGAETSATLGPGPIAASDVPKKKIAEKAPEPPLIPDQPIFKIVPCAVCEDPSPEQVSLLCCQKCRLTVHYDCYGILKEERSSEKWICDPCTNDMTHQYSHNYDCVLCPVRQYTDTEIFEQVKTSHKKKSDREREKDRLERELIANASNQYREEQEKRGRPLEPRQAVKRTSGNNWAHVICMIFHYWVKLAQPRTLEASEGFGAIPRKNYLQVCKLCKTSQGACIDCPTCKGFFHAACAQQFGYHFGLNITPVKASLRQTMRHMEVGGDIGFATATVYCKEHPPKHALHPLYTPIEGDVRQNALQSFACTHKNIRNGGSGAGRKAAQIQEAARRNTAQTEDDEIASSPSKRQKTKDGDTSTALPANRSSRVSPAPGLTYEDEDGYVIQRPSRRKSNADPTKKNCSMCDTDVSPKWHFEKILHHDWARSSTQRFLGIGPPTGRTTNNALHLANHLEPDSSLRHEHPKNETFDLSSAAIGQVQSREIPEPSNAGLSDPKESKPNSMAQIDGPMNGTDDKIMNGDNAYPVQERTQSSTTALNGSKNESEQVAVDAVIEPLQYLCHKCFIKQKNPVSPAEPTPHAELDQPDVQDVQLPSPQLSSVRPQVSAPPSHDDHQAQPSQAEYHCNGPERVPNGIARSPPLPISPPAQHYTAPSQQHYGASPYPYPSHAVNGHERPASYRPNPGVHYMPPPANGYPPPSEPPSFVYRRNPDTGHMMTVPYIPRGAHTSQVRQNSSSVRSPPTHHTRSPSIHVRSPSMQEQGPHGPPEADSNPFALPSGPSHHSSPQPQYVSSNVYESRRGSRDVRERPQTPTTSFNGRGDGRWPSEIVNGASASPSVRNLLSQ